MSGHIFSVTSSNIKQSIRRKLLDSSDSKDVFCLRTEEPSEIVHISKGKHEKDKFKKFFRFLEGLQEVYIWVCLVNIYVRVETQEMSSVIISKM